MLSHTQNKLIAAGATGCLLMALLFLWQRQVSFPAPKADSPHSLPSGTATAIAGNSSQTPSSQSQTSRTERDAGEEHAAFLQRLKDIQNDPEPTEWPGLLLDLMLTATLPDVQALLAASDSEFGDSPAFQDEMKAAAYERWYHLEPAAALRAMDHSTMASERKIHLMEVFLDDWSGRDPQQVAAFLQEGELAGVSVDKVYGAVARGASLAGAVALVDFSLSRISDPKLHSYAVRAAARHLQRDHAALFEEWMAALPPANQGAALAESAWILSDTNIDQALANLERLAQVEAERVPVTRARVAVRWAEKDPGKAADWVATQNLQGEERESLFANVLSVWFSKDRDVAVAWVEALIAKGQIDEDFMNRVAGRL